MRTLTLALACTLFAACPKPQTTGGPIPGETHVATPPLPADAAPAAVVKAAPPSRPDAAPPVKPPTPRLEPSATLPLCPASDIDGSQCTPACAGKECVAGVEVVAHCLMPDRKECVCKRGPSAENDEASVFVWTCGYEAEAPTWPVSADPACADCPPSCPMKAARLAGKTCVDPCFGDKCLGEEPGPFAQCRDGKSFCACGGAAGKKLRDEGGKLVVPREFKWKCGLKKPPAGTCGAACAAP